MSKLPHTPESNRSEAKSGASTWFTDQALEQCRKTVGVYREAMPISGKVLARGVEWLTQAERLRLDTPLIPFAAEETKVALMAEYGYGLDAPWPITALEYEHGGIYDVSQDYTRALCTRRIALCVAISSEMTPGMDCIGAEDWGSLLIWPISYFDEKKEWEFSPGFVIIPRAQAEKQMALASNQYLALAHEAETRLKNKGRKVIDNTPMTVRYQPMLAELCDKLGVEHSEKMIKESSLDALWVMLGAYTAMGCKNVFINADSRALYMLDEDGKKSSLDPFRGHRKLGWSGRGVWSQETRMIAQY